MSAMVRQQQLNQCTTRRLVLLKEKRKENGSRNLRVYG